MDPIPPHYYTPFLRILGLANIPANNDTAYSLLEILSGIY